MNSDAYAIRPGRADDLPHLAEVERSAAITYFEALGAPFGGNAQVVPADVLEASIDAGLLWVAADGNDVPVGFLVAQVIGGFLFVKELSVARDHQRTGLGRRLMQAAEDHARGAHHAAMALTTDRFIPFNGPFYQKLGFAAVPVEQASSGLQGIFADEIAGGFDPARRILMMKPLAALQSPGAPLYPERI